MLRIALADLSGEADVQLVGASLADLGDACLEAALQDADMPFAVIGMGKLGGRELNYSSDLDVMFVFDGDPAAGEAIAEELMKAIGQVTPEGQTFRIDAALRPEGKSGPLARSLEAYLEYYARWSQPWEHQALIKARVVAGDPGLGDRLIAETRRLAFPEHLTQAAVGEMRHLKARMEKERIPRGTDPRRNLKLGPGGMSDIEFAAQMLQLRYGHHLPFLQVAGTVEAIDGARVAEILSEDDTRRMIESYLFLMRLRNRLFFLHGRPVDALPTKPEEQEALGIALGFEEQPRQELEDDAPGPSGVRSRRLRRPRQRTGRTIRAKITDMRSRTATASTTARAARNPSPPAAPITTTTPISSSIGRKYFMHLLYQVASGSVAYGYGLRVGNLGR
jgi:glutamate-ammonia-ligase adenylyltransferase